MTLRKLNTNLFGVWINFSLARTKSIKRKSKRHLFFQLWNRIWLITDKTLYFRYKENRSLKMMNISIQIFNSWILSTGIMNFVVYYVDYRIYWTNHIISKTVCELRILMWLFLSAVWRKKHIVIEGSFWIFSYWLVRGRVTEKKRYINIFFPDRVKKLHHIGSFSMRKAKYSRKVGSY